MMIMWLLSGPCRPFYASVAVSVLIFFLTLTKYAPFSKDDIINILTEIISFERKSLITGIVNEIYRKTGASVFTISVIAALWSSSEVFIPLLSA